MKLLLMALTAVLLASCSSDLPDYYEAPQEGYNYYSGAKEYGNHYCKVQEFTHRETGKKVTLIGMIHIGDQSFYRQVDVELDKADLVLEEGIHGLPSFGINKYFSEYSFSVIQRFTGIQGLVNQGIAMKDRENSQLADMNVDEFKSQSNIFTPLIQLVALPLMIFGTEPYFFYKWNQNEILDAFTENGLEESEAGMRHDMLVNMDFSAEPAKVLLPGIIEARNAHLIKELNKALEKEDTETVAIPWGAAHMPALEEDIIHIGFEKTGEGKWLRSIAVSDYLSGEEEFQRGNQYHGFPYILNVETQGDHVTTSAIFSILKSVSTHDYERFSLLWGDLFDSIRFKNGGYTSFLPKIAGKPIFFDLAKKDGKQRFRFLWFFQWGELEN